MTKIFRRQKTGNLEGYKLSLEGGKLKDILTKLLETLKDDELTLNKLNEYLKIRSNSSKVSVSDIDKLIKNIQNNSDLDDKKIEITAYKKSGSLSKILVSIDNNSISIEKNKEGKNEGLKLSVVIEDIRLITLTANFEGLQSKQNVKENIDIEISLPKDNNKTDVVTYKYKIYNDINFTNESTIENLSNENSVMLTDLNEEQLEKFINTLTDRISKVNKQQMEKLNLKEDENPILYLNPIANIQNQVLKKTQENIANSEENRLSEEEFLNNQQSEIEKLMQKYSWNNDTLNAQAIETFNKKFELYQNTNLTGQTVKGLLSVISLNNEDEENQKIKEINFNGQEYDATEANIAFIKGDIDLSKNYKVEFEKDENTGIIFRTIINVK